MLISVSYLCWLMCISAAALPDARLFRLSLKPAAWAVLSYNKIPKNLVEFSNDELRVQVRSSAGPIVYKLPEVMRVYGIQVLGKFSGEKTVEGGAFDEDSILRIGLVATGKRTLSGPQRWFAADWVKKLFSLAPDGVGLDKIHFFNVTNRANLVGKSRSHPKSELIDETVSALITTTGPLEFSFDLKEPLQVAALWLSTDGDDTKSAFDISISELHLRSQP